MDEKVMLAEAGTVVTTRKFVHGSRTVSLAGFRKVKVVEKRLGLSQYLEEAFLGRERVRVTVDLIGPARQVRCLAEVFSYKGPGKDRRSAYEADPRRLHVMRTASALARAVAISRWEVF
jgi:hypothetical protein